MPAWSDLLTDEERAQATAYIASLQGSAPTNPKPPQGEVYEGI